MAKGSCANEKTLKRRLFEGGRVRDKPESSGEEFRIISACQEIFLTWIFPPVQLH